MDKTIETKFFEAFKWGGVVDKCIDWIRYTYNLPPVNPRASTKDREETPEQIKAKDYSDALKNYQGEILLVGVNYDRQTKKHSCRIESITQGK